MVAAMYNGHGGEIFEGERNGYYIYIWKCECGAKGRGSPTPRQALDGLRKHCGLPALPKKSSGQQRPPVKNSGIW